LVVSPGHPLAAASGPSSTASAGAAIIDMLRSWSVWVSHLQPREAAIDLALTAVIVAAAYGINRLVGWLLRRGVEGLEARGLVTRERADDESEGSRKGAPRIAAMSWALLKLAIIVGAAVLVLEVWGLAPLAWLNGKSGAALARVAFLVVIGVALLELGGRMMDR
jgi:hypothetical protein